jgi:hypothetical protein
MNKNVIIIDPEKREINYTSHSIDLKDIIKSLDCQLVEMIYLYSYPNVTVICDEEGRLKNNDEKYYVQLGEHIFVNKIMLVNLDVDKDGETIYKNIESGNWIYEAIKWMPKNYQEGKPAFSVII